MKKWIKILAVGAAGVLLIFSLAVAIVFANKQSISQRIIQDLNSKIEGRIEIEHTQLSIFTDFPNIAIDFKNFTLFEDKTTTYPLAQLQDVYIGFNSWKILKGNFEVASLIFSEGKIEIVQFENSKYNLTNAFKSTSDEVSETDKNTHFYLKKIELNKVLLSKVSLQDSLEISSSIDYAKAKVKLNENQFLFSLLSEMKISVQNSKKTFLLNNKYVEINTDITYDTTSTKLFFGDTNLVISNGVFDLSGSIDMKDNVNLDLRVEGLKKNFDLFIALAPPEIEEVMKVYKNQGEVFFEATIKGPSINGFSPAVEARFGCENGFFNNLNENKKLSNLSFVGTFTNGLNRNITTSELKILNFNASPEAGIFKGNLHISNFQSPKIDVQLDSDFDLNFLSGFFNLDQLQNLSGNVRLKMNFKDIIDLENPELALNEFNQSYFSELEIKNLNFSSTTYHLPITNLNVKAVQDGNLTTIETFRCKLGKSDLSLQGNLTHLPSIVHQTAQKVDVNLIVNAKLIDFTELTYSTENKSQAMDEKLHDFSTQFKFSGAANTFFTSSTLPIGNFYIENLTGKLQNYPHVLNDFFGKIYIGKNQLEVQDFRGKVDDSDMSFTGTFQNYSKWFDEMPKGDALFSFDIQSNQFRFRDLFTYKNENHIPEDYRDEVITEFKGKGDIVFHYNDSLQATSLNLKYLSGRLRLHPLKFENFSGKLHWQDNNLQMETIKGNVGSSVFSVSGNYYLGDDLSENKNEDFISLKASVLDLDELTNYETASDNVQVDHDDVFNIFEVPFKNITIQASIGKLNYHKYLIENLTSTLRMQENHYVYVDDMRFEAAGGKVSLTGYFNGSNPDSIYMHPKLKLQNVDLDKLLFKFDNFGQDQLISENLHGIMTGNIQGKVLLHKDLTPYVEKSNLIIDIGIQNGRLENFEPMQALASFFDDKNLNKVLFGSLENRLELADGRLVIPNMVINSSLGYLQLSGTQNTDLNMDYYFKIPLKMVTQVATRKLFGKPKEEIDSSQEDEIIYKDETRNTNYVNVRLQGRPDDYKISLQKNKENRKINVSKESIKKELPEDIVIDVFSW